jgi:hypothetical protein
MNQTINNTLLVHAYTGVFLIPISIFFPSMQVIAPHLVSMLSMLIYSRTSYGLSFISHHTTRRSMHARRSQILGVLLIGGGYLCFMYFPAINFHIRSDPYTMYIFCL